MAIRKRLFSAFNSVHSLFNSDSKFIKYTTTQRNDALIANHARHTEFLSYSKKSKNHSNIIRSTLDEFQKMEFDVVYQYNEKGTNNQNVNPQQVIFQLDRIEVLRKLKVLEQNESAFPKDEAQCLKFIAKVHLEEPGAQENLDQFIEAHPQCKKLLYLGQI